MLTHTNKYFCKQKIQIFSLTLIFFLLLLLCLSLMSKSKWCLTNISDKNVSFISWFCIWHHWNIFLLEIFTFFTFGIKPRKKLSKKCCHFVFWSLLFCKHSGVAKWNWSDEKWSSVNDPQPVRMFCVRMKPKNFKSLMRSFI